MYQVVFYGLMASPPTKAHQLILKRLLASYPPQQYTIDYAHDVENNKPLCTVRNDADEIVFSGTLESLGISEPVADVGSRVLERSIKRALAKRDCIDYIEICCVPSADGPPVLGKLPSAQNAHRQTMLEMAAAEVDETNIIVSDMEIALSQLIGLPSYTANTLIVLRDGLYGLLSRPDHLITSDEKKQSTAQRKALLNERKKSISHYLEHPTHEWLTPHGLVDKASMITLVMGSDAFNRLEKWFDLSTVVAYANEIVVIERAGSKPLDDVAHYSSTAFRDQIAIHAITASGLAGPYYVGNQERLHWVSPQILEYVQCHQLYQPLVSVTTDSEGDLKHFMKSASMSDALIQILNEQGLALNASRVRVFLGDVCDKGFDDLSILHDIRHRVLASPLKEKWLLIAGNRDDNKIRLLELLDSDYIRGFINNPSPYWNENTSSPAAFCRSLNVHYEALDIQSQRVIVLKWMLEKTMGAPSAFANRRIELQALLKKEPAKITDIMVMRSFIEAMLTSREQALLSRFDGFDEGSWVLPASYRGSMRWYIDNSHLMAVIDQTFYSHAGLPKGVFPYLQSGERLRVGGTREGFHQWIQARNDERKKNIDAYLQGMLTQTLSGISMHPAVQASLPKLRPEEGADNTRIYNTQSFDSFSDVYDGELLNAFGMKASLHGHQMALTEVPRVIRKESLVIVNVDTRLGEGTCELFPNGTVVVSNRVFCLSQRRDRTYFLTDSDDLLMGCNVNIKHSVTDEVHRYTVIAKEFCALPAVHHVQNKYLLVCYEKKDSSPFYSVDPVYGTLFIIVGC